MGRSRDLLLSNILKIALIFLMALVLLALVGFFMLRGFVKGGETEVPNIVGKTFVEASEILTKDGLPSPEIEGYKYSADLPKDHVVEQRPLPNDKVKRDRAIRVFLSRGSEAGTVPRLTGQTVSEAEFMVKSVGLEIGTVVKVHSDDFPQKGTIIAHTPLANTDIQRGSKISLLVSLGQDSDQITVPDVKRMKVQSASDLLESNGLRLGKVTTRAASGENVDVILEQTPQPDESANRGAVVDVVVGSKDSGERMSSKLVTISYIVPARPRSSGDLGPPDPSPRHVRIVIEDEGGTRTLVDKESVDPGEKLEYPFGIRGRATAKIYVDDMEWPKESKEYGYR